MVYTYFSTTTFFIFLFYFLFFIFIFDTILILFVFLFCFKAIQSTFRLEEMTLKDSSSDKVTEVSQPGVASQDFEKQLASFTLPVEWALKEKEKEIPLEAADKAPKSKLQIKLKP